MAGWWWSKGILRFCFGPNLRFETEDLDQAEQFRTLFIVAEALNLDSPEPEKNLPHMINWIVEIVKHLYDNINEHGEILTVHTKAMAEPNAASVDPKDESIENLQKKVEKLIEEVDETRQRSI